MERAVAWRIHALLATLGSEYAIIADLLSTPPSDGLVIVDAYGRQV
jgi:hypothetical protein